MPKEVSKSKKGPKKNKSSKTKGSVKPEKASAVPTCGIAQLQERALELIGLRSEGLYQSELRKQLKVDSAKCSKVVLRLERSGLINRQPADYGSRRTYLIRLGSASGPGNELKAGYAPGAYNAYKADNALKADGELKPGSAFLSGDASKTGHAIQFGGVSEVCDGSRTDNATQPASGLRLGPASAPEGALTPGDGDASAFRCVSDHVIEPVDVSEDAGETHHFSFFRPFDAAFAGDSRQHYIDTYLTEFYLLYLIREKRSA